MTSNNTEPTKTPRLTFTIGEFDEKVIEKMALKRQVSKSEVIRTLIHNWIENNHDVLKNNYQIDFDDITNELLQDTLRISLDKSLKPFEEDIIKELPEFFELVDDVSVEDLTEHFNVDKKVIKLIIFIHAKEIKKLELNLKLKQGRIYRV